MMDGYAYAMGNNPYKKLQKVGQILGYDNSQLES